MTSSTTLRNGLVLMVLLPMLMPNIEASNSRPPRNNDISNIADALKYLQDLDSYYVDRARVRYGKRNSLAQIFRNRLTDNSNTNSNSDLQTHAAELSAAEEPF